MNINQIFSQQLIRAMKQAGHGSLRTPSGVCLKKLVQITGVSIQMGRRYLKGEVLPNYPKILKLANALEVPASWLLFGESTPPRLTDGDAISMDFSLMRYILEQYCYLVQASPNNLPTECVPFLMQAIEVFSEMNGDVTHVKKLVNLVFKKRLGHTSELKNEFHSETA